MVLKANDRCTSCPRHDEFRGPRSDYVRQVASENYNNNSFSEMMKWTSQDLHWQSAVREEGGDIWGSRVLILPNQTDST
ncbi:hypothetical protein TNCV_91691 [Trichonephila clavipes]|nr:hypothetical protein TNCV_91691 [Trichonephila clavipes]